MTNPTDARGVEITPGDSAVWGFAVGRSFAMAEGVVLGEDCPSTTCDVNCHGVTVSLTPSGRVRVRVTRRSYGGGEKPVVYVAPDRLVVLRPDTAVIGDEVCSGLPYLPPSPLPTQDEENRKEIEDDIKRYTEGLRETHVPEHLTDMFSDLAGYHSWCARILADARKKLKELE